MNVTTAKVTLTGLLAMLSIRLEALALPVMLLLSAMVIDYITGLMAAPNRGDAITSYRSINGIAKKVCLLFLVAVGLILDCLIFYIKANFDIAFSWSFIISVVIALWLTVNEVISILENIQDIGIVLPTWLLPLVKNLKGKIEKIPAKEGEDEKKVEE